MTTGEIAPVPSKAPVSSGAGRLDAMDGFRGLLVIRVLLFHINIWHSQYLSAWLRQSAPILGFFFVLSGFVLTMIYGQRVKDARSALDFGLRRAGRQWPVHLFALGFLVCWELIR